MGWLFMERFKNRKGLVGVCVFCCCMFVCGKITQQIHHQNPPSSPLLGARNGTASFRQRPGIAFFLIVAAWRHHQSIYRQVFINWYPAIPANRASVGVCTSVRAWRLEPIRLDCVSQCCRFLLCYTHSPLPLGVCWSHESQRNHVTNPTTVGNENVRISMQRDGWQFGFGVLFCTFFYAATAATAVGKHV